ncbi:MAG TPA: phytanoyl-CoA dioxygenase family protein [Pirellulales bacterium]|jgi:hypothetical protein|nr:phytanoyl-CoA dioxygenase family protein [Pirellulales bacterium]
MPEFAPSAAQLAQFERDGFFIAEGLLSAAETRLLSQVSRARYQQTQGSASRRDAQGGAIKLAVHNELADDLCGAIVRSRRIVDTMERLLGGEVYHYHHKLILKDAFTGGAWEWHQDYGYWYNNGCLEPLLASCLIAIDRATQENGCLQVLRGSQHIGRIDHGQVGDQTGADLERVQIALTRFESVYCEMEPGSAIFFHSNLLHCSAQNRTPNPRWALICCYNAARNDPYKESRHPRYTPLEKWPDARVLAAGEREWAELNTAK